MKILLLTNSLFNHFPTGGARFYENIVKANPKTEFHSFALRGDTRELLPANLVVHEINKYENFDLITSYFRAVKGIKFDLIDIPDWLTIDDNLVNLLRDNKVFCERFCVALHGNNSLVLSQRPNKLKNPHIIEMLQKSETKLYKLVDFAYGISEQYANMVLPNITPFRRLNASSFLKKYTAPQLEFQFERIVFLNRIESTKGIESFIDLARTDQFKEQSFEIIGPMSFDWNEALYYSRILYRTTRINNRGLFAESSINKEICSNNAIFVFPSKFDSFNLTAADLITSGYPCVLSEKVPASHYLSRINSEFKYEKFSLEGNLEDFVRKINSAALNADAGAYIGNHDLLGEDDNADGLIKIAELYA